MAEEKKTSAKGRHWIIGITSLVMLAAFAGVGFLAYRTAQARNATPDADLKTGKEQTNPTNVPNPSRPSSTPDLNTQNTEQSSTATQDIHASTEKTPTSVQDPSTQSPNFRTSQLTTEQTITKITAIPSTTAIVHASTMKPPTYIRDLKTGKEQTNPTNVPNPSRPSSTPDLNTQNTEQSSTATQDIHASTEKTPTSVQDPSTQSPNFRTSQLTTEQTITKITAIPSTTAIVHASTMKPPTYIRGDTSWLTWGQWTNCDVTCGAGVQIRTRSCYTTLDTETCTGNPQQARTCADWDCPNCSNKCMEGVYRDDCIFCVCENDTIIATVKDIAGRPVYNVRISRSEQPYATVATTDENGQFRIDGACIYSSVLIVEKEQFLTKHVNTSTSSVENNQEGRFASLNIKLDRIEPLRITDHPEDQVSYIGQNVSYSCLAQSNPQPTYYEWFKDGIIIDEVVYGHNNLLFLYNVSKSDEALYTCRANSEVGSMYSLGASLTVIDSDEEICNPSPEQELIELPEECRDVSSEKRYYNVGKCSNKLCPGCQDTICSVSQDNCCIPLLYSTHNISCDTFDMAVSVITRCSCGPCLKQQVKVRGRVVSAVDRSPLRAAKLLSEKVEIAQTNSKGEFKFEMLKSKKRISVTFKDRKNEFISKTVIFDLEDDTTTYHSIALQIRAPSITLNASETSSIPLGGSEVTPSMELDIPAGAFHSEDGSVYEGNVKGSITFTDPIAESVIDTIQSDLTTRDVEGNEVPLQTYGMFTMQFSDENDNPLRVDGDMELFIDAEKANIDASLEDLPHLWFLNQESGEWEDIGNLQLPAENRKRRDLESRTFLVGNINVNAFDLTELPACNIDQFVNSRKVCYLKVRVYDDETMSTPLPGVEITAITNEQLVFDRYAPDFGRGRFSFFNRATTGIDGSACVRTFCARNDSFYVINVRAEYEGTYLTAHDPRNVSAASYSGTWPQDLVNTVELSDGSTTPSAFITMKGLTPQMADSKSYYGWWWGYDDYTFEYERYDYEQYENREFGPFYWHWWNYYLAKDACMMANNTENHVVFTGKGRHGDAYAYNTEPYDVYDSDDYEKNRTALSWYPYEGDNKRSCFIKILVDSDGSERFRVSSFGGGGTAAGDAMYGIRIDYSKPNPPNSGISTKTAACIEFKCSGFIREGRPFDNDGVLGDDQTVLDIAPTSTSYERCRLKYPYPVNTHLSDFLSDLGNQVEVHDNYKRVRGKIPSETLYPGDMTGLYVSSGRESTGYENALENCHAGDDRASQYPQAYPENPEKNYAFEYECY